MALIGWSLTSSVILISILLFFIIAICNRWLNDFGIPYNKFIAWPSGILVFVILAYTWKLKPAFGLGILISLIGGIMSGLMLGETPVED